jgi:hypothetical protein
MSNFLRVSSLICIFLAFGLTACDSGGGMEGDPQPGEVETTVEGTVTNSESGSAIDGSEVTVFRPDEDEQLGQATTDTTGSYKVSFTLPENDTPDQLVIEADAEDFVAQSDTVDFEQSLTQNFSLEAIIMEATASGKIRNEENAEEIEGASVTGTSDDGNTLFETTTDAAGEYQKTFDLSSQPDEVTITADAEDFEPADTTVGFAEEINADFDLEVGTTESTISGIVTDAETEESIDGATVTGARPGEGEQFFETQSGSDGEYEATFEVKATNEPSNVALTTQADGYETREDTASFSEEISKDVELTAETTESTASGTVTRANTDDPIGGATVTGSAGDTDLFETSTDENGQYEATFEVRVVDEPDQISIEADDSDFDPAEQTVNFASEITTDFSLDPSQVDVVVDGTVLAEQDESLVEGADVSVFRPDEDNPLTSTTSGSGGTYELSFSTLAPDAPDSLRLEADERRFTDTRLTVGFSESITQNINLPSIPISTAEELQSIQTDSDRPIDGFYVQTADIDLSDFGGFDGFEPIGDDTIPFVGAFNGNGFAIEGLTIDQNFDGAGIGLFGVVGEQGNLKNVILTGVDIVGSVRTGALVGENRGFVQASEASGDVTGSGDGSGDDAGNQAGGLVGSNTGGIENASASVSVEGETFVGGLAGSNEGSIQDSEATGDVSGDEYVGGLVGSNVGTVGNSQATGSVDGGERVGGLIGFNDGSVQNSSTTASLAGSVFTERAGGLVGQNSGNIQDSEAAVAVNSGGDKTGGLVGENSGGMIQDSEASGDVLPSDWPGGADRGGLVGLNTGDVQNSVSTGDVRGSRRVGGLVGKNESENFGGNSLVSSSRASGQVKSGGGAIGGLVGKNEGEIEDSKASGNLVRPLNLAGSDNTFGGLVGENSGTILNSFATGDISTEDSGALSIAGGLVGENADGEVTSSYAIGNIPEGEEVGGLVGVNQGESDISESYAVGTVTGEVVGGLVGANGASISTSYWDVEASGQSQGVGNGVPEGTTGLTTDEMQGESAEQNLDGFDFEETWQVVTDDYPALFWEDI